MLKLEAFKLGSHPRSVRPSDLNADFSRERGNAHGLASDYIWSIAEDSHGDLWLATEGGGVERWDRRTEEFQQFRHDPSQPQSLASDGVRALLIDPQGKIWAGTKDQGLDVLDPNTGVARHYRHQDADPHSLPADAIGALYADHEGRIWVGTDGGFSRFDPATNGFINYGEAMSAAHISATARSERGNLMPLCLRFASGC